MDTRIEWIKYDYEVTPYTYYAYATTYSTRRAARVARRTAGAI